MVESTLCRIAGPSIRAEDLPIEIRGGCPPAPGAEGATLAEQLAALEKAAVERALQNANGDAKKAAKALGVSAEGLRNLRRRHGV